MKRYLFVFLYKMKYFFVDKYENALNKLYTLASEHNYLIIFVLSLYLIFIHIVAVISFIIFLFLMLPILFICDIIDIFRFIFK